MHDNRTSTSALHGCYVISLRPVGGHAPMRRAAAAKGARTIALSPWRLETRDDEDTRCQLRAALTTATRVVVTSPAAARAARTLQRFRVRRGQQWYGTGAGTAAALRRAGMARVSSPGRMDSEGLLALLGDVEDASVAVLTAPGGRDQLIPSMRQRGASVERVDVYARVPVALSTRSVDALRECNRACWLMLSSGEALQCVIAALPEDALAMLRRARVVAASVRLARIARDSGFDVVVVATDATPRALVAAAANHVFKRG